jgi:hypothetical protein
MIRVTVSVVVWEAGRVSLTGSDSVIGQIALVSVI